MLGKKTREEEAWTPNATRPARDPGEISVITKDVRIVGSCETGGRIRIEGTVTGDVSARGLELGASGTVEGSVSAPQGAESDSVIVIGGRVESAVRAGRIEIQPTGIVLGGLEADEATVQGRVEGGVIARRRLALGQTAVVEGDVRAHRLSVQEGGHVNGTIHMGEQAGFEPRATSPTAAGRAKDASGQELATVGSGEGASYRPER